MKVFKRQPKITLADKQRLAPHLSNWNKLNEILVLDVSDDDLKKLLMIELNGKARKQIVDKLIGRITSRKREDLKNQVVKFLEKKHGKE